MLRLVFTDFLCHLVWAATSAHGAQPDVLMIVVDDLRPMLGCYGNDRIRTPNIDRLAQRGVVFERAYCQYAKCGTSRLSMLTGLRPNAIDVYSNNSRDVARFRKRRTDVVPLPRWLKLHGYHTQGFGKIYHDGWDVASDWSTAAFPGRDGEMLEIIDENHPNGPTVIAERFDCPVMQNPDVADDHFFAGRMTNKVLDLMKHSHNKPRFLAVGYRRPHLPFVAPKRYSDLYEPDESWLPKNPGPSASSPLMAWFNSDGYVGGAKRVGLSMPVKPTRQQAIDWNGYEMRSYNGVPNSGPITVETQLKLLRAYAACVSYVDAQIGRLLDGLRASPNAENTIIVLCSDHGWHLGEHSAWGKMTNFEIATRVPMIISVPGTPGGRSKTIAELVDLYPTLCELTETPLPKHLRGESLVSALNNPDETDVDSYAVSQYSRFRDKYMGCAIRTDRYRYVQWTEVKTARTVHQELYDHVTDHLESNNLVDDDAQTKNVERLQSQLRRIEAQTRK